MKKGRYNSCTFTELNHDITHILAYEGKICHLVYRPLATTIIHAQVSYATHPKIDIIFPNEETMTTHLKSDRILLVGIYFGSHKTLGSNTAFKSNKELWLQKTWESIWQRIWHIAILTNISHPLVIFINVEVLFLILIHQRQSTIKNRLVNFPWKTKALITLQETSDKMLSRSKYICKPALTFIRLRFILVFNVPWLKILRQHQYDNICASNMAEKFFFFFCLYST